MKKTGILNRVIEKVGSKPYLTSSALVRSLGYLLRDNSTSEINIDGLRILTQSYGALYASLKQSRCFEPGTIKILKQELKAGMFVIDVGANIGFHTLQMARLVGPSGRVLALEPAASNYRLLLTNLRLNGCTNVEAKQLGASDKLGTYKLYKTLNPGGDSLVARSLFWEQITTVRLDDLIRRLPHLVKIDVEGNEPRVLRGMVRTLESAPELKLIIEFNESLLARNGFGPPWLLSFLGSFGFKAYAILPNGELNQYTYGNIQNFENLLFIRN